MEISNLLSSNNIVEVNLESFVKGEEFNIKAVTVDKVSRERTEVCLAETKVKGAYSFVFKKEEFLFSDYVSYSFKTGTFLVLENGFIIDPYFVETKKEEDGFIVLRSHFFYSLDDVFKKSFYMPLSEMLKIHNELVEEMRNSVTKIELNSDLYVNVFGDREIIEGKTYNEEAMLSDSEKNHTQIVDRFSSDEFCVDTKVRQNYQVTKIEERYVRSNCLFEKKKVYYLQGTDKLAIKSDTFALSDVYLVTADEVDMY